MNIIVLDSASLHEGARLLDNHRLIRQASTLSKIICNILVNTDDYDYIFENFHVHQHRLFQLYSLTTFKDALLHKKEFTHSSLEWTKQSIINFYFVLNYYLECEYHIKLRKIVSANNKEFILMSPVANAAFGSLSHLINYPNAMELILKTGLYRNLPSEFDSEKDTITASKKYLTKLWKNDILTYDTYNKACDAWNISNRLELKPRPARKLRWGTAFKPPSFAEKELKEYMEGLTNAGNNSNNPTGDNTTISTAA